MKLTQSEYARRRGVSRQAVFRAVKRGLVKPDQDGLIDPDQADLDWPPNLAAPTNPNAVTSAVRAQPAGQGAAGALLSSRALREAYTARLARLEYEERAGKLVSRDEARQAAFNTGRRAREAMESIPDRLSPVLAMRQEADIHRILQEEVRRVLEEISRWATL